MSFTLLRVQLAAPLALFLQHISHFYEEKKISLHHSLTLVCTTCKLRLIFSLLCKKKQNPNPWALALSNLNRIAIFHSSF